jgi:branched-subunit amino acid ABC-type transport system permease component
MIHYPNRRRIKETASLRQNDACDSTVGTGGKGRWSPGTHSRPHVSDDNAFIESLFATLKGRASFPEYFRTLDEAGPNVRGRTHDLKRWFMMLQTEINQHDKLMFRLFIFIFVCAVGFAASLFLYRSTSGKKKALAIRNRWSE